MTGKPAGRTVEQQHEMLQHAIDAVRDGAANGKLVIEAEMRNQETQALTLIALELRELRKLKQSQHRRNNIGRER